MEISKNKSKLFTRNFTLILLANFFVYVGFQMTLPTIPIFINYLGGSDRIIGLIVGIFAFSGIFIRPYAGKQLEVKGRRTIILTGLVLFVIAGALFGFVGSMILLILLRIIQGFGWGFTTTASGTIATDFIPLERRGEGMGYFGITGNLALAIGPALGLFLVKYISFQWLFIISASFGVLSFLLASLIKYEKANQETTYIRTEPLDIVERKSVNPSIIIMFITLTFGGFSSFLPLYTAEINIGGIEIYFAAYATFVILTRVFAGKLYDEKGDLYTLPPGIILIIIAMIFLIWLPNTFVLILAGACYGIGFGIVQPALQAWAISAASASRKGMANATFFSFFDLGIAIGALIFGQVAFVYGYQLIYVVGAISVFCALIYYFVLVLMGKRPEIERARARS